MRLTRELTLCFLLATLSAGCELIASPDRSRIGSDTGGSAGSETGGSGGTTTGGASSGGSAGSDTAGAGGTSTGGTSTGGAGGASTGGASSGGSAGTDTGGSGGAGGAPTDSMIIYLTAAPQKANFGGIIGADAACNASPPKSGQYKALLVDGTSRVACVSASCSVDGASEGTDWVLLPSTTYTRVDGTVIGTTTPAGIFAFPLDASIGTQDLSYWTGLNADWTTSADTCSGWTETVGVFADSGLGAATGSAAIQGVSDSCQTLAGSVFACVEQ